MCFSRGIILKKYRNVLSPSRIRWNRIGPFQARHTYKGEQDPCDDPRKSRTRIPAKVRAADPSTSSRACFAQGDSLVLDDLLI